MKLSIDFRPMLLDRIKGYTSQTLSRDLMAGLIVGIVALIKVKRGTAGGKVIAIVGVMLNVLAIIVVTIVTIVLITWYGKIQHCVDTNEKDSNGTVTCHVDGRNFPVNTRGGIVVHEIP